MFLVLVPLPHYSGNEPAACTQTPGRPEHFGYEARAVIQRGMDEGRRDDACSRRIWEQWDRPT